MKHTKQPKPYGKLAKGIIMIFALKLSFFGLAFLIQSCHKSDLQRNDGQAKARFLNAIDKNKATVGSISATPMGSASAALRTMSESTSSNASQKESIEGVYVQFPDGSPGINDLPGSASIQDLSDLVMDFNAVIQYTPSPTNHGFNIPETEVVNSLNPLLSEARVYLNSKGFTNSELDQMIIDSGAVETDLIPFAMVLASHESPVAATGFNFSQLLAQPVMAFDVTWKDYVRCGVVAIGADFVFSAGTSTNTVWSKAAMKKAFGAVAKRMLGPIGVAIAVVSFGVCITEAYLR